MNYTYELRRIEIPNVPWKRHYYRPFERVDTAVFHRIHAGHPESDTGAVIAKFFEDEGKKWIGTTNMPYHIIIPRAQPGGTLIVIEHCVPFTLKTPHAAKWNGRSIGIGVVGDFRHNMTPTKKQRAGCLWIAQRLADLCEPHLKARQGSEANRSFLATVHSALTTGTSDPEKLTGGANECPGPKFATTWREIRNSMRRHGELIWRIG